MSEIKPSAPTFMYIADIWGSGVQNVYAVGMTENRYGQMWHFDGNNWSEVLFPRPNFSGGLIQLLEISGGSESDVWAVGWLEIHLGGGVVVDSTAVLHFDGSIWQDVGLREEGELQAVELDRDGNIWVGGTNGSILRFDRSSWVSYQIPSGYFVSAIHNSASGELFATAYAGNISSPLSYLLLAFDQNSWIVVDSTTPSSGPPSFGGLDVVKIEDTFLTVGAGGCYRGSPTTIWQRIVDSGEKSVITMEGFSKDNFFCAGSNGFLAHFDGHDFMLFSDFPAELEISGMFLTPEVVLFSANNLITGQAFVATGHN